MTEDSEVFCEPNPCIDYMYKLWQYWGEEEKWCIFIMLNPARPYKLAEDRTVSNCRIVAKKEKCSGMVLIDLFPRIAGHWSKLLQKKQDGEDILGSQDEHDKWLREVLKTENALIIVAWGDNPKSRSGLFKKEINFNDRVKHMEQMISDNANGKEIKYLKGRNESEPICHPYWLADDDWHIGETTEKYEQRVKNEVLENYELAPYEFQFV